MSTWPGPACSSSTARRAQGGFVCKHMGAALPVHLEIMLALDGAEKMRAARPAKPTPHPAFDDADDPDLDINNWQ